MKPADIERVQKNIMVVYSPDGGNGKSEIAANLAFCLARQGKRIWVIDANTVAPSQDILFHCPGRLPTFAEFLLENKLQELPAYRLSEFLPGELDAGICLTPSRREDPELLFRLQELMDHGLDGTRNIPEAIYRKMIHNHIDAVIIDTFPGFGEINQMFLAIAGFLLIVSRITDVDLRNLRTLLQDESIMDIQKKLVVFNNIELDERRQASPAMENTAMIQKLSALKCAADFQPYFDEFRRNSGLQGDGIEIYDRPFLYSRTLALFGQGTERRELFVQHAPRDPFSLNIDRLAHHILAANR
ncbi:MAG: AAA family ATPase [Methanomicrobiales archaeon]|nr:AAA family ATPase [Methanomicrobiales archaeon]